MTIDTAYVCISDRFCADTEIFSSVEEFQSMCVAVFGETADLTFNGAHYVDENGRIVLAVKGA